MTLLVQSLEVEEEKDEVEETNCADLWPLAAETVDGAVVAVEAEVAEVVVVAVRIGTLLVTSGGGGLCSSSEPTTLNIQGTRHINTPTFNVQHVSKMADISYDC